MSTYRDLTAEQLRAHRETVLLRLLIRVNQIESTELTRRLIDLGHADLQPSYIGLLANTDTEGTRLITVARRLGTSRQAVGQLVNDIVAKGYLERVPDPDDGRAVLVRHTAAGRGLLADALQSMDDIEAGYEEIIGSDRMRALKESLALIAAATDPDSALRADGSGAGGQHDGRRSSAAT